MPKQSSRISRGQGSRLRRANVTEVGSAAANTTGPPAETGLKARQSAHQRKRQPAEPPGVPVRELDETASIRYPRDGRRRSLTLAKSRPMLVLRWPLDHLGWSAAVVAGILVVVAFALAWMITHRVDVDVVTAQPAGSHDFLVPAAAVQNQGGSDVVFVVVSNTAYRQPVLVVNSGATDTIASGLSKGAVVVVDSVSALKDGQTVHISNG